MRGLETLRYAEECGPAGLAEVGHARPSLHCTMGVSQERTKILIKVTVINPELNSVFSLLSVMSI